ncbi:MAG: hypothetical protein RLN96_10055, partial [Pseudomonadales bacterium]
AGYGFYDDACYKFFLLPLLHCLGAFHVCLHAYCLLSDRVLLLCTPQSGSGLHKLITHLNYSYSEYFNTRFRRATMVWDSAYSRHGVAGDNEVLQVQKFIERLPVCRRLVTHAGVYQWSSYCCNSFGRPGSFLTPHPAFSRFLAQVDENPFAACRAFIATELESRASCRNYPYLDKG